MQLTINILHLSAGKVIELGPKAIATEEKRRQAYLEQMAVQRAKFFVHDGFVDMPVFKGIIKSHKAIVQFAKDNKMPKICIMEDDCQFTHPDSLKYFFKKMPKEFDLYFGLIYQGEISDNHRVINGLSGGLTLYVVHEKFYDTFINCDESNHIDYKLGQLAWNQQYYVCYPYVCIQPGGYSYNHKRELYYDEYLRGRILYTG